MVEVIIHAGMRGTGGRGLAAALAASDDRLRAAGVRHLGADGLAAAETGDPVAAADALVAQLRDEGIARAVLSEPDWFQRIDALGPFLQRLDQRATLRILIWMRPARSWLDAQDLRRNQPEEPGQDLRPDPRQDPDDIAVLVSAYAPLLRWTELFGPAVCLRPFHDGIDMVAEFGDAIGVGLTAAPAPGTVPAAEQADMLARISVAAEFDISAAMDGPAPPGAGDRIALLERRLAAAERRHAAVAGQLHRLAQPQLAQIRDRLQLAIALDDPQALYAPAAVTAEVGRLRDRAAAMAGAVEERDRLLRREAELLSSTSWRVTAPLRAVSRLLKGRRG